MARPHKTLGDVAAVNLLATGERSVRATMKAARVGVFLWCLARQLEETGDFPTQAAYAKHWHLNERTAERDWAAFTEVFPGEDGPERLGRWVASERAAGRAQTQASTLGALAPPDLIAAA
jgi:hypothetical protein